MKLGRILTRESFKSFIPASFLKISQSTGNPEWIGTLPQGGGQYRDTFRHYHFSPPWLVASLLKRHLQAQSSAPSPLSCNAPIWLAFPKAFAWTSMEDTEKVYLRKKSTLAVFKKTPREAHLQKWTLILMPSLKHYCTNWGVKLNFLQGSGSYKLCPTLPPDLLVQRALGMEAQATASVTWHYILWSQFFWL